MVQLSEISWKSAENLLKKSDVVILPVGSTEQHGPHNPLGTDYLVAEIISKIVGEKTGTLVLPTIPFGISEHHRHFSGSVWIPPNIFSEYVKSVILSIAYYGPKKIVVINGHGGNESAIMDISMNLRIHHDIFVAYIMAFPPEVEKKHGHASSEETSINLFFFEKLVDMNKAENVQVKNKLGLFNLKDFNRIGPAKFAWDTKDLTDTGVFGPAGTNVLVTTASKEKGKKMVSPHIKQICTFIDKLKRCPLKELLCKNEK